MCLGSKSHDDWSASDFGRWSKGVGSVGGCEEGEAGRFFLKKKQRFSSSLAARSGGKKKEEQCRSKRHRSGLLPFFYFNFLILLFIFIYFCGDPKMGYNTLHRNHLNFFKMSLL